MAVLTITETWDFSKQPQSGTGEPGPPISTENQFRGARFLHERDGKKCIVCQAPATARPSKVCITTNLVPQTIRDLALVPQGAVTNKFDFKQDCRNHITLCKEHKSAYGIACSIRYVPSRGEYVWVNIMGSVLGPEFDEYHDKAVHLDIHDPRAPLPACLALDENAKLASTKPLAGVCPKITA